MMGATCASASTAPTQIDHFEGASANSTSLQYFEEYGIMGTAVFVQKEKRSAGKSSITATDRRHA